MAAEKACLPCHKDGRQSRRGIAAGKPEIRFNHKLHLALDNIGPLIAAAIDSGKYLGAKGDLRRHLDSGNPCAACHREIEEAASTTPAHLPQMADCLVCHNRIELPFSCEKCHTDTAALRPASHTPDYLERH